MTQNIRIGIIGSGGIARSHVRAYKQIPGVKIVALADVIPGKAAEFARQEELSDTLTFERHEDLLDVDLNGVSICTPNAFHHRTTVDSLLAGKNVLLEKPMSVTLEEAVEMTKTSKETGKMLTIGFQPRYDPNLAFVREFVQTGQLGKVYYVETGGGRRRGMPGGTFIRKELAGTGAIADIGCYSLDMALHVLGYPEPLTVSAYASNYFGTNPKYHKEAADFNVEDFGVAMIRFKGDLVLNFKISWAMHMDTLGSTLFLGTDAGLKVDPAGEGKWSGAWSDRIGRISLFHDIAGHPTESSIPVIKSDVDVFREKVNDFVTAIRDHKPAPIPASQILINQAIIDGIMLSSQLHREVEIHIPDI